MERDNWKPGNMLYPLPAVMVSVKDKEKQRTNIITIAWCGNVCTNPPMVYISVRKERRSYKLLLETNEFVINLVNEDLVFACDYCGVKSGNDVDKFKHLNLTENTLPHIDTKGILESPVNIECKVNKVLDLGSHTMFIADVVGVNVDKKYLDSNNKFDLNKASLITYSHGEYFSLGSVLGKFGYSIKKSK